MKVRYGSLDELDWISAIICYFNIFAESILVLLSLLQL